MPLDTSGRVAIIFSDYILSDYNSRGKQSYKITVGKSNINTCRVSELYKQNINIWILKK